MSQVTMPMVPRMRALWDVGLSYAAIAAVVSLDWGAQITDHQVRGALRGYERGTSPAGGARRGVAGMTKVAGRRFAPDMSGSAR